MSSRRKNLTPYLYILPWVVGFILFTGGPIIATILLSFTKWDLISPPIWIGFSNFIRMFKQGSEFWGILKVTFLFTVFSVLISITWALFMALLLNQKLPGTDFFSFFYFAPAVVPLIALTFVFQLILN